MDEIAKYNKISRCQIIGDWEETCLTQEVLPSHFWKYENLVDPQKKTLYRYMPHNRAIYSKIEERDILPFSGPKVVSLNRTKALTRS